ncbi:MAG: hypothetical protein AAGO57_05845, partial [Pseudomonadota bacterium]
RPLPAVLAPAPERAEKLNAIQRCERLAFVAPASAMAQFSKTNGAIFDAMGVAPTLLDDWPNVRAKVAALTSERGLPPDGVFVIGQNALDREWLLAGKLGGYLHADQYFGASE